MAYPSSWWAAPVTSYSSNYRQEFRPVTSAKEVEVTGSGFVNLLNEQIKKAEKAMKEELEQQLLYGRTYKPNPELRKAIGNAYDSTIGVSTFDKVITEEYMDKIRDNVFSESPIMKYLKDNKEKAEMNAVEKIVAERKEARAREIFDKLDLMWEDMGDLISYDVKFKRSGTTYNYGARRGSNDLWYVTGVETRAFTDEEFKANLADLAVGAYEMSLEGEWL